MPGQLPAPEEDQPQRQARGDHARVITDLYAVISGKTLYQILRHDHVHAVGKFRDKYGDKAQPSQDPLLQRRQTRADPVSTIQLKSSLPYRSLGLKNRTAAGTISAAMIASS